MMTTLPMLSRRPRSTTLLPALALLALGALSGSANASSPTAFAEAAEARLNGGGPLLRNDCSGLVMTVLHDVGAPRAGNTRTYWAGAARDGRVRSAAPAVGDLAFFDKTYDANGNGRVDDELTHVAIVTAIDGDGTVQMVHRGSGRITRLVLNTQHSAPKLNGKKVNSYLRAPGYGAKNGPRLAGQLLRGFARPPLPGEDAPAVATTTKAKAKAKAKSKAAKPAPSSTTKKTSKRPLTASKTGRAKDSKNGSKRGKTSQTKKAKKAKHWKKKSKAKKAKRSKKRKVKKVRKRADGRRVDHRSNQVT